MQTILVVFHLFLAVGLIGLILIQHGKGADMGAAFGSGASGTVFGAKGSASFLTRLTAGLATLFFITSMVMAYYASQRDEKVDIFGGLQQPAIEVEAQSQGDVPPVLAPADNDMPPVPAIEEQTAAPQPESADLPVVPAADTDTTEAVDAPVEAAPAVDAKE